MGLIFTLTLATLTAPRPSDAWVVDGVAISTLPGNQGITTSGSPGMAILPDGAGGALITWEDGGRGNVFGQRVNANGKPLWQANGVPVAPAPWFQFSPRAVSDGAGGMIVTWVDGRQGFCSPGFKGECDIFAQRVDTAGNRLWQAGGIPISTAPHNQGISGIAITSDGAGGAIMAWEDARPPNCCRIFAQRVDASGRVVWTPDGVPISPPPTWAIGPLGLPLAVSDGAGGALIAWLNIQVNPITDRSPIAVQRVDANGQALWAPEGVSIGFPIRGGLAMAADGLGGAIVAFPGQGLDGFDDIFAQRISGNGQILWQPGGVPITNLPLSQLNPDVVSDGASGAIIVWQDERNGTSGDCFRLSGNCDIYAQRVNANGQILWQTNGLPISTASNTQISPRLVGDGSGRAIIAWQDCRAFADRDSCIAGMDIYAQWVNASGQILWQRDGIPVSRATGNQGVHYGSDLTSSIVIASDDTGGAFIAWPDGRTYKPGGPLVCWPAMAPSDCDLYIQRVTEGLTFVPGLTLKANQLIFRQGEQLTLTALVTPDPTFSRVDAYIAIQLPDTSLWFMQGDGSFTREVRPIVTNVTVAPFIGQIFHYTFGGGELVGNYTWFGAFTRSGTLDIIGEIAQAPFSFNP